MRAHSPSSPAAITAARFNAAYLNNPEPKYPPLSRRLGEEGKVLLKVRVLPDGNPASVDLEKTTDVARLLNGVDTVYYLVHGMGESKDFIKHERRVAENVRDAARDIASAIARRLAAESWRVEVAGTGPTALAALRYLEAHPEIVDRLNALSAYARDGLRKKKVKMIGTTIAIIIGMMNFSMSSPRMARIPGKPPTPIELARTPMSVETMPAIPEPIIAATKG